MNMKIIKLIFQAMLFIRCMYISSNEKSVSDGQGDPSMSDEKVTKEICPKIVVLNRINIGHEYICW